MRATTPIGTLIQKMSCQPAQVVRAPPSRTPPGYGEAADRSPQRESSGPLHTGVGGHDDRQRGGGHEGRAESLAGAGGDEFGGVAGEAAEKRSGGEHDEAGEEDPPSG